MVDARRTARFFSGKGFSGKRVAWGRACRTVAFALPTVLMVCGPLAAQNDVVRAPGDDPFRNVSRSFKLRTDPATPPEWVVKTRKPENENRFLPTGAAARTEPAPAIKLDRIRELERELDSERARHDRLSGRSAAPAARRSVAMEPIRRKKAAKRDCALTCASPIGSARKR
jgi:hypothetical protein